MTLSINFDNSYARLPDSFYQHQLPTSVASPSLLKVNHDLAKMLNIDAAELESKEGVDVLAGNAIPQGAEPIATVYAAHQFGNWNPQLGDGRAVLLGEVINQETKRFDLQLKGSGRTPYSRGGDGRAPLGPVLREYIVSEAMFALGVPTSRSLAAVTTGEMVMRDEAQPGAVLTRVAKSHIRIGTFQFFASKGDTQALKALADHVIVRHYPHAGKYENPYLGLLHGVIENTASLVSRWQQVGFIHGVMNTDNMLISGETVDYGPCAFMDAYHPETVFSSIDVAGRYAYQNQPKIAHWNVANFAQCLIPLLDENEDIAVQIASEELDNFPDVFYQHHRQAMAAKIGISEPDDNTDGLMRDLLSLMAEDQQDFTQTFTALANHIDKKSIKEDGHSLPAMFTPWIDRWRNLLIDPDLSKKLMIQTNPQIIPRNHRIEEAIQSAISGDYQPFHDMVEVLKQPFDQTLASSIYALAPKEDQLVEKTFCGT
ncbi:MAG: hypothetical protein ACI9VI_000110 [Candidatus Azotimanducaceae bacterium]|jgi:uncharacterized protein YdiU (UPF0061 family)